MGLCNRYCCADGPAGGRVVREGGGKRVFGLTPAGFSGGCRGCGETDTRGPGLGRESLGAGQGDLTSRKLPASEWEGASPADRTHQG